MGDEEIIKIRLTVETGFAGADHVDEIEITPRELDGMTLEEYCEQYLRDMIANYISGSWEIVS